jgi:hypothetical protein
MSKSLLSRFQVALHSLTILVEGGKKTNGGIGIGNRRLNKIIRFFAKKEMGGIEGVFENTK